MKTLILGHKGMLGNAAHLYFTRSNNVVTTCDYRWDTVEFKEFVLNSDAEYIINCIGSIPQKNSDRHEFIKCNIDLPIFLESTGKKIIHPSTDCEFSGSIPYPQKYRKKDFRDANDDYGVSKALISEMITSDFKNTKSIRTSIIGHELNSKSSLLEWFLNVDESQEINGYANYYWNGVTTLCWCKSLESFCRAYINSFPILI